MRILFFAHLKDVTGCPEIELPGGAVDPEDLWCQLTKVHPGLAPYRSSVRLARNSEYVGPEVRFADTDEIALIPPVSGG
jgi:molybdopterin converting factor subunit 1